MLRPSLRVSACLLFLASSISVVAQQTTTAASSVVPSTVNFSGIVTDGSKPLTGVVGVTFCLYKDSQGGSPLWIETQNVQADQTGHYSVVLGSTASQGLPTDLFASGEARWLGVQVQGQPEQPRVMLLSVPYALKALDAETVGGQPASAFMMAPASSSKSASGTNAPNLGGSGTTDFIPLWTSSTTLGNSKIFQSATGNIGVGTTTPAANLDVKGTGDFRGTLTLIPAGISPTLTVNGTTFNVSSTGLVHFIPAQTFPGTGTITGVTTAAGSGLSGGGTTGTLNLSLLKTCATGQILQWSGSSWVCSAAGTGTITGVKAGIDLTGGGTTGTVTLNLDTTKVPQLGTANSFTGNQSVTGNISATGLMSAATLSGNGAAVTNLNAALLTGLPSSSFAVVTGSNTFPADQFFNGSGKEMIVGDPGCGSGFAGIGFGALSSCTNYSMTGDGTNTYINRPSGGTLYFRESNATEMTIAAGGNVIGTTTPGTPLEVDGSTATPSDSAHFLGSSSGTGGYSGLVATGGNDTGFEDVGGIGGVSLEEAPRPASGETESMLSLEAEHNLA